MYKYFIIIFISSSLTAQEDPFFMPFEGDVFKLPAINVMDSKFGYSDQVLEYEKIGTVSWPEINIPLTETTTPFPDVNRLDRLGMVLDSEMIIKATGCYSFRLISDDGSRFWIGDLEIINNDGTHKMTQKMDTLQLAKGKYPIKLWYYQGFKNKYGFIFDGQYLDQNCDSGQEEITPLTIGGQQSVSLQSKFLFGYDSADIKDGADASLDSLATAIKEKKVSVITIKGFTCDQGSAAHNSALSQKRADAIRDLLMKKVNQPGITYRSIGMGSQEPIASNDTKDGKNKNRRVEIQIE